MKKGLLLSYPLYSHNSAMKPLIMYMLDCGVEMDYFNTSTYKEFITHSNLSFKEYKNYTGLGVDTIDDNFSLYNLGISILDSFDSVYSDLELYIQDNNPDFIIHPKFAFWANILAEKYHIPALSITSGFVFHPSIIYDFQKQKTSATLNLSNIIDGKNLYYRFQSICKSMDIKEKELDSLFINSEDYNIVLNSPEFQPSFKNFENRFEFLGMSFEKNSSISKDETIYISLGTVFSKNKEMFDTFINVFKDVPLKIILFTDIEDITLPSNFEIAKLGYQTEYLQKSKLFITHGGACGILEAIYYKTPMIVIPQTIEHEINGVNVERNKFGVMIKQNELNEDVLKAKLTEVYNTEVYRRQIDKYLEYRNLNISIPDTVKKIINYLN